MTILEAIQQRYSGGALDVTGKIFSTPTHLITSAFAREGYLEGFARGVEPSELLYSEDTSPALKIATDVVLDPLTFLGMGAGVISKMSKAGKFANISSKVAKGATPIDEITKGVFRVMDDVTRKGQSVLRKDPILEFMISLNPEETYKFRKVGLAGIGKETLEGIVRKTPIDDLKYLDETLGTGDKLVGMKDALDLSDDFEGVFARSIETGRIDPKLGVVLGRRAARGRALEASKLENSYIVDAAQEYLKKVKADTPEKFKHVVQQIEDLYGPLVGKEGINPSFGKKFVEFATMMKLTGLSTHVRATVGNTFSTILRFPEKVASGAVDALTLGVLGGGKSAVKGRTVYAREVLPEFVGMWKGLGEASRSFMKVMRNPTAYFEEATKAGETLGRRGAIGGTFGEIVRAPGRIIGGIDVFFKRLNESAELYARATRTGLQEGLRGSALARRVTDIIDGKDIGALSKLQEYAKLSARERVFQEELQGFLKTMNEFRMKHPLARFIVPFFTTPVNLFKQAAQRIPGVGFTLPSTWKAIRSRGREAWSEMIARQFTGGVFLGTAMIYAAEGNISGLGPRNKAKRTVMRLAGWQPSSVKVGNTWVSYRGFEPISSWLRTAADAFEGIKEGEASTELIQRMLASYVKQFAENPFFMGIHDVYEAFSDPQANAENVVSGMVVGSVVPNLLQQFARGVFDPVVREPKDTWTKIAARTPLLSKTVKPLRDVYGEPIVRDKAALTLVGLNVSVEDKGKLANELARLGIGIGKPSKTVAGIELTDDEYERMYLMKGAMLKESLERLVNYENYDKFDDEMKIKMIRKTIRTINSFAKSQAFEKYYSGGNRQ